VSVITKPRILFITGVSASGKTHTGEALDKDGLLAGWWDLDEYAARPNTAWLDWLRWRAAEYLLLTADMPPDDRRYVVTGITWPFRVIESPVWDQVRGRVHSVDWLMLDPPWPVIRDRLNDRLADKPRSERQELLRYNRELRQGLRDQVEAYRGGFVCTAIEAAEVQAFTLGMVRS
jgi:hypothetical protein